MNEEVTHKEIYDRLVAVEATVTSRLSRHLNKCDCWRKSIALWAAPLLDPYDPAGKHL